MKPAILSDIFSGVVTKRLTLVETITPSSNQHEFQGVAKFKDLLGLEDRRRIPSRFIWLSGEQEAVSADGFMSWSNVRKGKPRAPEYHLYYSGNAVTEMMRPGDVLFLALMKNGHLLAVIVPEASTVQSQLLWLFGLDHQPELAFSPVKDSELDFSVRFILDELGIDPLEPEVNELDRIIERYGMAFPTARIFSAAARASLPDISVKDAPDAALLAWMEREEQMFKRLERRIIAQRIAEGFQSDDGIDVDGFFSVSLSFQNRRKARAGLALENHLEHAFSALGIRCQRGAVTDNKNKPDFLFPGATEYADATWPSGRLTMLGAKSTLKDRWRQVLSEAERIPDKHLLTLEPGVSENQTDEMRAKKLQLVVPSGLHATYRPAQRDWLMSFGGFVDLVRERQGG